MCTPHELQMIPTPSYTLSVQSFNWGRYTHLHIYTDNTSWTADRYTHLHIHNVYSLDLRIDTHTLIYIMYIHVELMVDLHTNVYSLCIHSFVWGSIYTYICIMCSIIAWWLMCSSTCTRAMDWELIYCPTLTFFCTILQSEK